MNVHVLERTTFGFAKSISGRIKLVMLEKRLLRMKTLITNFVSWLNGGPDQSDWFRKDCTAILRSADPASALHHAEHQAILFALGGPKGAERSLLAIAALKNILEALRGQKKSIRECACGCGKWFLPDRRNQRHYGDHRKRASVHRMTDEKRERRRVQNKQAQARHYAEHLKAKP
jgi:hypothetical protein